MKCGRQIFLLLKVLRTRKGGKCGTVGGRQKGLGEKVVIARSQTRREERGLSRSSGPGMGAQACGEELGTRKGSRGVTQTCSSLFRRCCPCWETRAAATTARSFLISLCFPPSQNRTIGVRIRGGGKKSPFVFFKSNSFCKQNKSSSPFPSLTPKVYPLSLLAFPFPSRLSERLCR